MPHSCLKFFDKKASSGAKRQEMKTIEILKKFKRKTWTKKLVLSYNNPAAEIKLKVSHKNFLVMFAAVCLRFSEFMNL